jgi:hypothetical protein
MIAALRQVQQAVFHYDPAADDGRWEMGISTPTQRELAWRYGHRRFIIMDGTFNLCSKTVLCFIVLVVDEDNHGLPVAFLLLTPRNRVSGSSSDYNSQGRKCCASGLRRLPAAALTPAPQKQPPSVQR